MDNFRKFNTPRKSSHGGIDGFANRPAGRNGQTVRRGSIGNSKKPTAQVGSFKGMDGFRPIAQNRLTTSAQSAAISAPMGMSLTRNV
jgi:hypothetical protein